VFKNAHTPIVAGEKIMSADNGVYVLMTKRAPSILVYRVAMASAIDNVEFYRTKRAEKLDEYLDYVWGKSDQYDDLGKALIFAHRLDKKYPTEYGVKIIDMADHIFQEDRASIC
jgi:hypothetical protein